MDIYSLSGSRGVKAPLLRPRKGMPLLLLLLLKLLLKLLELLKHGNGGGHWSAGCCCYLSLLLLRSLLLHGCLLSPFLLLLLFLLLLPLLQAGFMLPSGDSPGLTRELLHRGYLESPATSLGPPCGCSCSLMVLDSGAGTQQPGAAAAAAAAAAASTAAAAEAEDSAWERFVSSRCQGLQAAWADAWRLFRLDAVKAMASPRNVRVQHLRLRF